MAQASSLRSVERLLHSRFGLRRFRPGQEHIIHNVLRGRDTLAVLPTGAGKSLCYQLPALALRGATVVVSPLISLMADQARKLQSIGVEPAVVNSTLSASDEAETLGRIRGERSEVIFVTPERLAKADFLEQLAGTRVALLVVDEAHCISQWGHDFRPAFLEIAAAGKALGNPVILALTATATSAVIEDIRQGLGRPRMDVVNASVYRENLHYAVRQVSSAEEKQAALFEAIDASGGSLIVYTATVKATEEVYQLLRARAGEAGRPMYRYHGRLAAREREQSQEGYMSASEAVMVATNAFGMGIDKPDVRAVIHYQTPASVEAYYQESGRAGRDEDPARCLLLFDMADTRVQSFFLRGRYPGQPELALLVRALADAGSTPRDVASLKERLPDLALTKLRVALRLLVDAGIVRKRRSGFSVAEGAGGEEALGAVVETYAQRGEDDRAKLEQMISYAHTAQCRWKYLLEYFGETPPWERCGGCDNCEHPITVGAAEPERTDAAAAAAATVRRFVPGQRVATPTYGRGTVQEVHGEKLTVRLDDGEERQFMQSFLRPAGPARARPAG